MAPPRKYNREYRREWTHDELVELYDQLRKKFSTAKAIWIYDYCWNWNVTDWYAIERYEDRRNRGTA